PPSSPIPAPYKSLLSHPPLLQVFSDNAPTDWPACSTPHNSTRRPRTPRPPRPASSPPALQTVHGRACPSDNLLPSRSTHIQIGGAHEDPASRFVRLPDPNWLPQHRAGADSAAPSVV